MLGNMFSAGVMISAGFCHLLGEALKQMPKFQFPLAPFLCGTGYLLTLVADRSVAAGFHQHHHPHDTTDTNNELSNGSLSRQLSDEPVELLAGIDLAEKGGLLSSASPSRVAMHPVRDEGARLLHNENAFQHRGEHSSTSATSNSRYPLEMTMQPKQQHQQQPPPSVTFLTAILMGVALVFHSLLEGAAMGAQSTISNSFHIFIAIVSHKGLAAYALGSSVVDALGTESLRRSPFFVLPAPPGFWGVVLPFTFASPLGIFLGFIASDFAQGVGAASVSALAAGTFLYVAFMEVIPKELRDPRHAKQKVACLLGGFAAMSILAIWA